MYKNILIYKGHIFKSIGILVVLSLFIGSYSGVKEGYFDFFCYAMIITPIMLLINSKKNLKADLIFYAIMVFIIALFAIMFWKYKDGVLFNPDIESIPMEVRYQFSFENRLTLDFLFFYSFVSALISLLLRFIYSKLKDLLQANIS